MFWKIYLWMTWLKEEDVSTEIKLGKFDTVLQDGQVGKL